ncbi:MAG: metalloregulator ArsR/SmtB family transcription factor [Verrucomicrobia bacterium]|nr:metalloregulator ArsR/SmtB family transcription factor [Verrucomicrobiota bacterium]
MKLNRHHFSKMDNELADMARAIAHPARIAILRLLLDVGKTQCGEIVDAIPLSQPAVSRHLHELKKAGLVNDEPCGTRVCYYVDHDKVGLFCRIFSSNIGERWRSSNSRVSA